MDVRKLFAFTETLIFTDDLLKIADDETLFAIQNALLENPLLGDVIRGTSGARKGRIGDPKRKSGKRVDFDLFMFISNAARDFICWLYTVKRKRPTLHQNKPLNSAYWFGR